MESAPVRISKKSKGNSVSGAGPVKINRQPAITSTDIHTDSTDAASIKFWIRYVKDVTTASDGSLKVSATRGEGPYETAQEAKAACSKGVLEEWRSWAGFVVMSPMGKLQDRVFGVLWEPTRPCCRSDAHLLRVCPNAPGWIPANKKADQSLRQRVWDGKTVDLASYIVQYVKRSPWAADLWLSEEERELKWR